MTTKGADFEAGIAPSTERDDDRDAMHRNEAIGSIVDWGGKKMRVGRCPPGDTCLACDRIGSHLEPLSSEPIEG